MRVILGVVTVEERVAASRSRDGSSYIEGNLDSGSGIHKLRFGQKW